jgi:probable phosphoglycerate mutase
MTDALHELWLVRHGETEWTRSRRHTGRTDIGLTREGDRQARALGQLLAGREFTLVLTSPLRRARETCRIAGYGDVARETPDLAEWDYGEHEGLTREEIRQRAPGWTIWSGPVPGGESASDVAARADRVIDVALRAGGDVAVFGHGHQLRVLATRWVGLPITAGALLTLDTAALSVLGHEDGVRVLRRWNLAARPA